VIVKDFGRTTNNKMEYYGITEADRGVTASIIAMNEDTAPMKEGMRPVKIDIPLCPS